jgi:adenylosuccinate synthase
MQVNGYTSAVLTRLDVLDGFKSVKICKAYELDDQVTEVFPGGVAALERAKPIYEEMPGWSEPTASVTQFDDLPKEAKAYVERLQELIGCPIDVISTGPYRHETVRVRPVIHA